VGYSPFSLSVIHKEGLCLSNVDINRLMMMMLIIMMVNIYPDCVCGMALSIEQALNSKYIKLVIKYVL
jgi:hypothetical protein